MPHGTAAVRGDIAHGADCKVLGETPLTPHALHDDVPPALSALVMHALARDRDARPASARTLHDALEQLG